jgi:hypothetical protein
MNSDAPAHYEQLLAYIGTHMPAPFTQEEADGAIVFTGGSPAEVIVRLTDASVTVEEYAMRWESPYSLVVRPRRVGVVKWRRLPESRLMTVLGELIKGARESRRGRFRTCTTCGRSSPPEWMADSATCQSCDRRELRVVH